MEITDTKPEERDIYLSYIDSYMMLEGRFRQRKLENINYDWIDLMWHNTSKTPIQGTNTSTENTSTENTLKAISTTMEHVDLSDLFAVMQTVEKEIQTEKDKLRNATRHQMMSKGAIQLKVDTFGRQATILVQVFRDMPGQLDMIGWPDTRRILDQPGKGQQGGFSKNLHVSMEEARKTAEKEDIVDLSRLEKPFSTMFPKEVLFMSSPCREGMTSRSPSSNAPACRNMSESEYENVRRGDVSIEAMKTCKEIPIPHMRLRKLFYGQISLVSTSQDLPWG
ncbi:hypothetical protein BV898_19841 [Hypsibius exemplaris]|uniref:Uncharacterized protein n=1 Tax=Hypsibius exemplaris TaxID=2072580 RepID=A0A9X6NLL4_HYPEX|nr:hypothetical protein BV898_19841 [Hypsibius exemplaris]